MFHVILRFPCPGFHIHLSCLSLCASILCSTLQAQSVAHGSVYHDLNHNGQRDANEPGVPGVRVSNQKDIVKTDEAGRWSLPAGEDTTFFVIKPRDWRTPLNAHQLPQFYYNHKPQGSPESSFPGLEATGPLPESIDFALYPSKEPETFEVIFFGDPQPRDIREVTYIGHDVVEELIGTQAKFGVTLGDIVFDDLGMFEPLNATIALVEIPWFNVIGNHDMNMDASNDEDADETFTRIYGPNYYAFDYGPVHFIALDDVIWGGKTPEGSGTYTGGLDAKQLAFLRRDLEEVPEDRLVVLMMHIPLRLPGLMEDGRADGGGKTGDSRLSDKHVMDGQPDAEEEQQWREIGAPGALEATREFVAAVAELPSLVAVLTGHIHDNNADPIGEHGAVHYTTDAGCYSGSRFLEFLPGEAPRL